jgi:hypothetical protein
MNLLQKLSVARVKFQESGIKPTGENSFARYKYYELGDILPVINRLGSELFFFCVVSFTETTATLSIYNTETDSKDPPITFTSPMSTASLKGCHEVQNLGAVQTYIKRYLYQNAFEIVEADVLNKTQNPDEKPQPKQEAKPQPSKARTDAWTKVKALILSSPKRVELEDKFRATPDTELDGFVTWVLNQP